MISLITLGFSFLPASEAISQSKAKFAKTADDIKDYSYGSVQVGGYIYTIFNSRVDMENGDKEEMGAAIVGGLIMSFAEAGKKDYIGVIIINTSNEAIAMTMESASLKKFTAGKLTVDELLAETSSYSFNLDEVPGFNTSMVQKR